MRVLGPGCSETAGGLGWPWGWWGAGWACLPDPQLHSRVCSLAGCDVQVLGKAAGGVAKWISSHALSWVVSGQGKVLSRLQMSLRMWFRGEQQCSTHHPFRHRPVHDLVLTGTSSIWST